MFSNKSVFNAFAVSCHLSEAKTTLDSALRLRRPQKDGFNNALDGSERFLIRNSSLERSDVRQTDLSPSEENFCISHLPFIPKIPTAKNKITNLTACQTTAGFLLL